MRSFGTTNQYLPYNETTTAKAGGTANAYKEKIIQRDKTKQSVGWGPVHLGKHLCFRGVREQEEERERRKKHPE